MKKLLLAVSCLVALDVNAQVAGKNNLMYAAEYNDTYRLQKYLQVGYDINSKDSNGNTAYCYAYNSKSLQAAQLLQRLGADTSRKCNINGVKFRTASINSPYATSSTAAYTKAASSKKATASATSHYSGTLRYASKYSLLGASKGYVIAGVAVAGAAAASGGGGGGSDDSSSSKTSTPIGSDNPADYETAEFYGNASAEGLSETTDSEFLDMINAQYAYARGYDGSGQIVAILDTGLDTDHSEFSDSLNTDLSGVDMQASPDDDDPNHGANDEHGTTVAAVAAADKDDNGMHGVAYGAKVLPYRIGIDGLPESINANHVDDAISDGIAKGARVFNMSFGSDASASSNMTTASSAQARSSFGASSDTVMNNLITELSTSESIIVKAAGNESYSQPGVGHSIVSHFPAIDGHYVTVVAVDGTGSSLDWYSNSCGDAANYCIAAPGDSLMTASDGGGYTLSSGTSLASPVVSGAIAVVQDAFGLSADRTLNILFQTATDLGAAGVDSTFGQGLLNLDAATAPGAESITSISSTSSFEYVPTSVTTSSAIATLSLPNFVIEDELYRTFTINSAGLIEQNDEEVNLQEREKTFAKEKKVVTKKLYNGIRTSFIQSNEKTTKAIDSFDYMSLAGTVNNFDISFGFTSSPGQNLEEIVYSANLIKEDSIANPYLGLSEKGFVAATNYELAENLSFQTNVFFGEVEDSDNANLGKSNAALAKLVYDFSKKSQVSLETGFINEQETLLGSKLDGVFAIDDDNYTYFTGLTAKTALTKKLDVFANAYVGVTKAGTTSNSLITEIGDIVSHSATIGAQYNISQSKAAGFVLSQPLKVSSGDIGYTYLSGGNIDKGYQYTSESQSLAPSATQLDVQAFYKQKFDEANLNVGLLHSINADSIKGESDTSMLIKYRSKF